MHCSRGELRNMSVMCLAKGTGQPLSIHHGLHLFNKEIWKNIQPTSEPKCYKDTQSPYELFQHHLHFLLVTINQVNCKQVFPKEISIYFTFIMSKITEKDTKFRFYVDC